MELVVQANEYLFFFEYFGWDRGMEAWYYMIDTRAFESLIKVKTIKQLN